jgi:hypothetical protein
VLGFPTPRLWVVEARLRGRTADTGLSGKRSMHRSVNRTTILEQVAAPARRVRRASATGTFQVQRAVRPPGRRMGSRTRPPAEHDLNRWCGISCRRPHDPGSHAAAPITPSISESRLAHGLEPDLNPASLARSAADPGATRPAGCGQACAGPETDASAQGQAPDRAGTGSGPGTPVRHSRQAARVGHSVLDPIMAGAGPAHAADHLPRTGTPDRFA